MAVHVDRNMRRATRAGWDRRFGPPPFDHGEFVAGLRETLENPGAIPGALGLGAPAGAAGCLAALEREVGFQEGPDNENPYGPWQGVRNAAWCDSFAQWAAVVHGGFQWPGHCQFGEKGDAYCPYTKDHAVELGWWRGPEAPPQPGWQVLFSWDRNGVPDHIGTVLSVYGDGSLRTVEGNYRDTVALVDRDLTYVDGFVALPWDGQQHQDPGFHVGRPLLRRGFEGAAVRELQRSLERLGYDLGPHGADGDFGAATEAAVRAFQRDHRDSQGNPLEVDGVAGGQTWAALDAACAAA